MQARIAALVSYQFPTPSSHSVLPPWTSSAPTLWFHIAMHSLRSIGCRCPQVAKGRYGLCLARPASTRCNSLQGTVSQRLAVDIC